jgi:selenocysteine lyase/cysteine desulfurase
LLAVPAAIELQHTIGRDHIAARIAELNGTFRREASKLPNVTVHTPLDPSLSGGITCFEVRGLGAEDVTQRLAALKIRTTSSPYKVSYPRVSAGIMNRHQDIDSALAALRRMA